MTSQVPTKATGRWPLPSKERRLELYHADGRKVARLAIEVIGQVGAYERNISRSAGDEAEALRFLLIESLATEVLRAARRAANRYHRARP